MTYKNQLINEDKIINDLKITLNIVAEEGTEYNSDIIINPKAGTDTKIATNKKIFLSSFIILIVEIILVLMLMICKRQQNLKITSILIVLGMVMITIITYAEEKYEVMFKYSSIVIKGEFKEYIVTFDTDGGTEIDSQTVVYGQKAIRLATDPEKEAYEFVNWYKEDSYETVFDFAQEITSDTTIYAFFKDPCNGFSTASWDIIADNVYSNPSYYALGCEKEIELETYGIHKVRITNNTTPSECSNTGFSETACGFVLEFSDIIITGRMNPYDQEGSVIGDGNNGGWENYTIRNYVNTTIYNSLPSELKMRIADTKVVSGHGLNDSENFNTTDKLYLLNTKEVW